MSLVAGLSTGVGGSVVFFVSSVSATTLAFTLSLAAGVMTSVSILELMKPLLHGTLLPVLWACGGAVFYQLLRLVLPENGSATAAATGHKRGSQDGCGGAGGGDKRFSADDWSRSDAEASGSAETHERRKDRQWRLGVLMMVTLTAHNFPEVCVRRGCGVSQQRCARAERC